MALSYRKMKICQEAGRVKHRFLSGSVCKGLFLIWKRTWMEFKGNAAYTVNFSRNKIRNDGAYVNDKFFHIRAGWIIALLPERIGRCFLMREDMGIAIMLVSRKSRRGDRWKYCKILIMYRWVHKMIREFFP